MSAVIGPYPRSSAKVRNVEAAQGTGPAGAAPAGAGALATGTGTGTGARGALCQVSGGRWVTFEGELTVSRDAAVIADAERRHAVRYGPLDPDPRRVVLRLVVDRVLGSEYMTR